MRGTTNVNSKIKAKTAIKESRSKIDLLDRKLLELVCRRMKVAKKIGLIKAVHSIALVQKTRRNEVLRVRKRWARELFLDSEFVEKIFCLLHAESVRLQTQVGRKREVI